MQKYVFKISPMGRNVSENFCVSVDEPLALHVSLSMRSILYQICTTCMNFKTNEEYLQELEHAQADR